VKRLAAFVLLATVLVRPGPVRAADEGPPSKDVQKAIDAGAGWLRARYAGEFEDATFHDTVELLVLTLSHCGANFEDKVYAKAVKALEKIEPRFTYRTALLAMALNEVNPRLYRRKLMHCAQWLVDTQLKEGEWGYPGPPILDGKPPQGLSVPAPEEPETPPAAPGMSAEPGMAAAPPKGGAKASDRVRIERRTTLYAGDVTKGDFSNTQFAILGLRACRDAGIDVPPDVWKGALGYLKKYQRKDGGWGYVMNGAQDDASYASLTCAGICSAVISLHSIGAKDPKSDTIVARALAWVKGHADIEVNAGVDMSSLIGQSTWQYYHLYSLERAGRVLGTPDVGGKAWYGPGATWLLSTQKGDGHWEDTYKMDPAPSYLSVADTCFALLFLTRATRPLTGG
jgi:hypothetical protein